MVTVQKAPVTIGMIVTFMFPIFFFNSLAWSRYFSFYSLSFSFILWSAGTAKSTILQVLFLLLIIISSGLLAGIRWSVCISKSSTSLCVSFFGQLLGCAYTIFSYGQIQFLAHLPVDHIAHLVVFSLILLLHSLIMWLMVLSLSPHNQHLLFCYILSILALIGLVFMALFGLVLAYIIFFLLRCPFLSHVQVFFAWGDTPWEFLTPTLTDGLSLDFDLQPDSSIRDSFQYSDRSQQCCCLNFLPLSSFFQVSKSFYRTFGDYTKSTTYNWYNCYFHAAKIFLFPSEAYLLILLFAFIKFYSVVSQDSKVHNQSSSLYFVDHNKVWPRLGDSFVSQNLRGVCASHLQDRLWVVHWPFFRVVKLKLFTH